MIYSWYDDEECSMLIELINVIKVNMHIFLNMPTAFYTSSLYLGWLRKRFTIRKKGTRTRSCNGDSNPGNLKHKEDP